MVFLLVFLMLVINICVGVYIVVVIWFLDKYDVIIYCVLYVGFFIQCQIGFIFCGEVMVDVDYV